MAIRSRSAIHTTSISIFRERKVFFVHVLLHNIGPGVDPEILEKGCLFINVCTFTLLTFSYFS